MRHKVWPTSLAFREGLANAASARLLSILVVATTAALTAGIGLANALDVSALVHSEAEWINAGGYAFVVEPGSMDDGASLDVAACERLAGVDGIGGAFALEITDRAASPANAPGTRVTFARVSPGIYQFFGLDAPGGADVIATASVAEESALADGEFTLLTVSSYDGSGAVQTAPVTITMMDSPMLAETFTVAYLSPELISGQAQQCYVVTNAAHLDAVEAYLAAALASGPSTPAIVHPLMPNRTYGIDFATAYGSRTLGWAWAAGAVALAALWAVVQVTRRTRMAIYATFGAPTGARLTMQLTEWTLMTGIGAVWGWAIGLSFSIGLGADVSVALTQVTWQVVATWCVASLGAILVGILPVGTLLDALKDRA